MPVDHALIADIYRSTADSNPLSTSLDQLALRYDAMACSIIVNDFAEPVVSGLYLGSKYQNPDIAPLITQFMEIFGPQEQVMIQRVGAQTDRFHFLSDEEAYGLPSAEIPANIWNRAHLGIDRRYGARLSVTPSWFDILTVHFPNGHLGLTPDIERDLENYMFHFSAALGMARPFNLLQARFKAIFAVLDRLKVGVAMLTDKGELVFGNRRFDDILQQQDGISLDQKGALTLGAAKNAEQARFSKTLTDFCSGDYGNVDQAKFVFPKRSGGIGYVASLCPLTALIAGSKDTANMTALIVKDPSSADHISVDFMTTLCELTQAETQICKMLVNGKTIHEIAQFRNVHHTTTRNQVASIFEKTGASSQSQLIRFALNIDLPVEDVLSC